MRRELALFPVFALAITLFRITDSAGRRKADRRNAGSRRERFRGTFAAPEAISVPRELSALIVRFVAHFVAFSFVSSALIVRFVVYFVAFSFVSNLFSR